MSPKTPLLWSASRPARESGRRVAGRSEGNFVWQPWTGFNKDKETIVLKGLTGTVAVTARY